MLVTPEGVATGAVGSTTTLSAATLLVAEPSAATTEIARVAVLVPVVAKVTDSSAAWYWAGVALPLKVSVPVPLL